MASQLLGIMSDYSNPHMWGDIWETICPVMESPANIYTLQSSDDGCGQKVIKDYQI